MTLSDLDAAPSTAVALLAHLHTSGRCGQGTYAGPCPLCGAEGGP